MTTMHNYTLAVSGNKFIWFPVAPRRVQGVGLVPQIKFLVLLFSKSDIKAGNYFVLPPPTNRGG
ncbi:hypothetical protein, partial [Limosilactobacillus rudii]|uniref:hypothetical protein n=1 Tax=Limosilactobacillus rudii TaxID=2759755 RepID=UPI001C728AF0